MVVPVIAAVTAEVLIRAPPEFFGTRRSIAPPPRSRLRVPSLKLKIVFAPRRASVASVKVSSARDSSPVRTAVPSRTGSLTLAGRGAAWAGRSFTSLTTWLTRASFNCAACALRRAGAARMQIAKNLPNELESVERRTAVARVGDFFIFCRSGWPRFKGKPANATRRKIGFLRALVWSPALAKIEQSYCA